MMSGSHTKNDQCIPHDDDDIRSPATTTTRTTTTSVSQDMTDGWMDG
jgi:hypothetical protein